MAAPFLTAPDGTTAPTHDGTPVDLTGVPLTTPGAIAPQLSAGDFASILAAAFPFVTVGGLIDMTPASVGRSLRLDNASPPPGLPPPNDGNRGEFPIISFIDPTSVVILNPIGFFPDPRSGSILWEEIPAPDEFDAGNPLTNVAERSLASRVNITGGPAAFLDFDPLLPPVVVNDPSGVFGKVQSS